MNEHKKYKRHMHKLKVYIKEYNGGIMYICKICGNTFWCAKIYE